MSDEHAIDLFLGACGMTVPLRLEVERPGAGGPERRAYHRPFVLIGRASDADLSLDDPQVGRRHALLQVVGGRVFCLDLASRTGTYREGGGDGSGWLSPGQALCIGPFVVRLRGGAGEDEPGDPGSPIEPGDLGLPGLPDVCLEFPGRRAPMPPWRMDRVLALVGRSRGCKVRLSGGDVSQVHCALVRTPVGLWAVDLLGRGGMAIDGRPARWGRLGEGDELEVGSHRVRARYGRLEDIADRARGMLPAPSWPGLPGLPGLAGPPTTAVPAASGARELLAGRPPEQVAATEALLGPLLEQMHRSQQQALGQMQQQMSDQFQQVLMVVLQMFGRMHRDQMELVREELGQIRRVTDELQAVQAEVRRLDSASGPRANPAAPRAPSPGRATDAGPGGREGPAGTEDARSPRGGREETESVRGPTTPPTARPAAPPPAADRRPAGEGRPADPAELHALLARRVAALQQDQQSHWQRLLSLVTGPPGG